MSNEEAINSLKDTLKVRTDAYYDYLQSGGKGDCAEEYGFDVLQKAIEALKKQIPRKPQKLVGVCGGEYCKCDCNHEFDYNSPYCPHCGQAIDWSDSK